MEINKRRKIIDDFMENHCNAMIKTIHNRNRRKEQDEVYFYLDDFCIICEEVSNALTNIKALNFYFLELRPAKEDNRYLYYGQIYKGKTLKTLSIRNIFTHYFKSNRTKTYTDEYDIFKEIEKIKLYNKLNDDLNNDEVEVKKKVLKI